MADDRSLDGWATAPRPRLHRSAAAGIVIAFVGAMAAVLGAMGYVNYWWKLSHECVPDFDPGIGCYGREPLQDAAVAAIVGVALLSAGLVLAVRGKRASIT